MIVLALQEKGVCMSKAFCSSLLIVLLAFGSVNVSAVEKTVVAQAQTIQDNANKDNKGQEGASEKDDIQEDPDLDEENELTDSTKESTKEAPLILYHPSDSVKRKIPNGYPVSQEIVINPSTVAGLKMQVIESMVKKMYFSKEQIPELQKEFITEADNRTFVYLKKEGVEPEKESSIKESESDDSIWFKRADLNIILIGVCLIGFIFIGLIVYKKLNIEDENDSFKK